MPFLNSHKLFKITCVAILKPIILTKIETFESKKRNLLVDNCLLPI